MRGWRFWVAAVGAAAIVSLAMGCGRQSADADAQRYTVRGMVLGKSALVHELTIQHGTIPDFMPATTTSFKTDDPAAMREVQPGDQITAQVLVSPNGGDFLLQHVVVTERPTIAPKELPAHVLLLGEQVPDIPLVDQSDHTIDLPQYRGKAVLLTFIDTQCTDDCPILTRRFETVNRLLAKDPRAYAASDLLSISLDPAYDKPPVLRKYGLQYTDGDASTFAHWEFAVTTPAQLKRLATAFGVQYQSDHGDIDHSMQTALIAPNGELLQMWGGDDWNAQEVANAVKSAAL